MVYLLLFAVVGTLNEWNYLVIDLGKYLDNFISYIRKTENGYNKRKNVLFKLENCLHFLFECGRVKIQKNSAQ